MLGSRGGRGAEETETCGIAGLLDCAASCGEDVESAARGSQEQVHFYRHMQLYSRNRKEKNVHTRYRVYYQGTRIYTNDMYICEGE